MYTERRIKIDPHNVQKRILFNHSFCEKRNPAAVALIKLIIPRTILLLVGII